MKNKIWFYREQQHMSLKQLAQLTGISKSELNNIENEKTQDAMVN